MADSSGLREVAMTLCPAARAAFAMDRPRPVEAAVTSQMREVMITDF